MKKPRVSSKLPKKWSLKLDIVRGHDKWFFRINTSVRWSGLGPLPFAAKGRRGPYDNTLY